MTFAEGVIRLVRFGVGIGSAETEALDVSSASGFAAAAELAPAEPAESVEPSESAEAAAPVQLTAPGLADLQAAIAMIEAGMASRIVLAGLPSSPGLLWQAYQLAEAANVHVLPTIVRPDGRVDLVIDG